MAIITSQATINETPDPTQGGTAVTTPSNTGHGSTNALSCGTQATVTKTCRWRTFQNVSGQIKNITLKFTWSANGFVESGASNSFNVWYSADGGTNWTNVVSQNNVVTVIGGSPVISIPIGTPISQIQVRDKMIANGFFLNPDSSCGDVTASVSSIRLDVEIHDQSNPIVMM